MGNPSRSSVVGSILFVTNHHVNPFINGRTPQEGHDAAAVEVTVGTANGVLYC